MNIWILSANSATATFYTAESPTKPLVKQMTLENPEARAKQSELTSARPGRSFDSQGEGRHAMGSEVDPKAQERIRFAKELAAQLEKERVENHMKRLVLVAAPAFLGLLRAELSTPLKALVSLELDKDYTFCKPDELRSHLPKRL